jgi:PAS domain-containing protein
MPQISKPYHHSNYVEDVETVEGQQADSSAQVENKRKMLRRAANRRSAQLSRARKKANLEELKIENNRLQRLVDILDSQPELVFCINIEGSISYMSERTESFMRINLSGDLSDEVPTNINQILSLGNIQSVCLYTVHITYTPHTHRIHTAYNSLPSVTFLSLPFCYPLLP